MATLMLIILLVVTTW